MAILIDSYSETNQDDNYSFYAGSNTQIGQSLNGTGRTLDYAQLYLKKVNSPTGTIKVEIYAHSGTYGAGGIPTGAVLATSGTINSADLTTSYALVMFTFTGANKISIDNGTKYFLVLNGVSITGGGSDYVAMGRDSSSASHGGNVASYFSSTWNAIHVSTSDICFYIYGDVGASPSLSPSLSPSITPSSSISSSPSPSIPPPMMVLRVAKSGINVLTNSDPEKFIFSSEYGTLKYFDKQTKLLQVDGTIGNWSGKATITHNLGYYPYVEVYVRVYIGAPSGNYEYCPFAGAGASVLYNASYVIKANTIDLYGEFIGVSSSVWNFDFIIFIYKNDLGI